MVTKQKCLNVEGDKVIIILAMPTVTNEPFFSEMAKTDNFSNNLE